MAAVKALQQWCKIQCEGYRDVSITNMTTSFRDGLAFCALIHKHRADLIDFDSLSKENVYENNHLAFRVAEEELGIPALLDAEDMVALKVPDRLSILTYVSQYYNYFHGRSPIGGLAGVKRPAEEPVDHLSGRKNQPVTAKTFSSPKTDTETKRDVPDKPGSINRSCSVCNKHVHLVQRHLVDGKLYHRNCFKCSECSNILLSGTYKPGKEPNTFICKSHQNTQKAPPIQVTPPAHYNQAAPTITKAPPTPKDTTLRGLGKDSTQSKLGSLWRVSKNEGSSAPTPTPAPKAAPTPTLTLTPAPKAAPTAAPRFKLAISNSVAAAVRSPTEQKELAETPKGPSSSVLRNLEARQRFFESSSGPVSSGSVTKGSAVTPANEKPIAGGAGAAGGAGKGKLLLRADDWTKDKKREKENDGDKEKAKSVISRFVTDETSKSSLSVSQHGGPRTNAATNVSPVPAASRGPTTRVLLKPPNMDLDLGTNLSLAKSNSWQRSRDKSPARAAPTQPSDSKESDTAPSDWRSMLKPVAKNAKPRSSQDSAATSEPKASRTMTCSPSPPAPRPANSGDGTSSPSGSAPQNRSTPSRGSREGRRDCKVESSTSHSDSSAAAKTQKPDHIPRDEILQELKEIETKLDELEKEGVDLEKRLRQCEEENQEDVLMNDLMVDWFNLIRSKQVYIRRESELVYVGRSQDLEEEQPNVEAELRKLIEKAEHLKTWRDKKREEELMAKLMEIVNDRNAIVDGLDEDRLREEEEDEQLNKMMQNLDMKKEKKKRSSMSRLFGWKSKREAAES